MDKEEKKKPIETTMLKLKGGVIKFSLWDNNIQLSISTPYESTKNGETEWQEIFRSVVPPHKFVMFLLDLAKILGKMPKKYFLDVKAIMDEMMRRVLG